MSTVAAILLSRQPLRPCGRDAWVRQTVAAVRRIKKQGWTISTSVGMSTWELALALASMLSVKAQVHIPTVSEQESERLKDETIRLFQLDPRLIEFKPCLIHSLNRSKNESLMLRDKAVIDSADTLLPVSVRTGGHMAGLVEHAQNAGKRIDRQFEIPYHKRTAALSYEVNVNCLNPDLPTVGQRYLIHWTRTSNGPWPNETSLDYYASIIESTSYPRTAFCTLMNMLQGNTLVATDKHMPHRIPTVSFAALTPGETIPLMRWRARYRQMSFEPYGIGIERRYAQSLGIQPVVYYDRKAEPTSLDTEPWLTQSRGQKGDWRVENEHRHRGSLHLSRIPGRKLLALCLTRGEATLITKISGVRAISFLS
ncbi:MAG: hypothetical protein AB1744_09455 [Candidatus Zixiibacteriota bacterium]